ncbi:MAG: helix-hairpin-helix domain-containing protein [Ginsengibacter sp.]
MCKRFANDYLSYTFKERLGIFTILGLTMLCITVPFLYPYLIDRKQYDPAKFNSEIAQLQLTQPDSLKNKKYFSKNSDPDSYRDDFGDYASPSEKKYYPKSAFEVFYFDPNTTTPAEWKRLGIRDKTIETIQKYLSRGGYFYKADDIKKVWGLHAEDINRLLPYVHIAQKKDGFAKDEHSNFGEAKQTSLARKVFQSLDINLADTTAFIALPGIGSKLAQRIINFRNKLGGFYSIDQVAETFGLPDSTFQKIKTSLILSESSIKKININTASPDDLKAHPYIRYNLSNAVIQYRNQHGGFSSVTDIKKIMLVTDDVYKKVEPYLTVTN